MAPQPNVHVAVVLFFPVYSKPDTFARQLCLSCSELSGAASFNCTTVRTSSMIAQKVEPVSGCGGSLTVQ